jgi:hypothetical protein
MQISKCLSDQVENGLTIRCARLDTFPRLGVLGRFGELHLLQHPLRKRLEHPLPFLQPLPTQHVIARTEQGIVWIFIEETLPTSIVLQLQPLEIRKPVWPLAVGIVFMSSRARLRAREGAAAEKRVVAKHSTRIAMHG